METEDVRHVRVSDIENTMTKDVLWLREKMECSLWT